MVVIIFIIPFYSLLSMYSILLSPTKRGVTIVEVVRTSYDAVMILSFFQLITAYMCYKEDQGLVKEQIYETVMDKGKIEFPVLNFFIPCFPVWKMDSRHKAMKAYNTMKALCLQYSVVSFAFSGLLVALIFITFVNGDPSKLFIVKVSWEIGAVRLCFGNQQFVF